MSENIIYIIISPIIIILILVLIFYSSKKKIDALKELSTFLNGTVSKYYFTPTFIGEYQGLKFSISLVAGSNTTPLYLIISLFKNSFFRLSIYKESIYFLLDLGKKFGILNRVKTTDEMFDREFLIFSNKPTEVMFYLNNMSIKNTIRELFNNGFNAIIIDGKKIIIKKENCVLRRDLQQENLIGVLQRLSLLAKTL
ncbi:MAG: hypothetical protein NC935_04790 [Candidatus Omnitrophica bacterium]|nr:hypothetical protein [Candidatus Omnitrophota bacterium]